METKNEQIERSLKLYRKTGDIEHLNDVGRIMEFYRERRTDGAKENV